MGSFQCLSAQRIYKASKRLVSKVIAYEKREVKLVRDKLIIKQKEVLRGLRRLEGRAGSGAKKVISEQIKLLEEDIGRMERLVRGNFARDIVDFGVPYYFSVTVSEFGIKGARKNVSCKGKVVFFEGKKASVHLKDAEGKVVYDKKVAWSMDVSHLVLDCDHNGLVFVGRRKGLSNKDLNMEWESRYQVKVARQKKR